MFFKINSQIEDSIKMGIFTDKLKSLNPIFMNCTAKYIPVSYIYSIIPTASPSLLPNQGSSTSNNSLIIGISVGLSLAILIIGLYVIYQKKKINFLKQNRIYMERNMNKINNKISIFQNPISNINKVTPDIEIVVNDMSPYYLRDQIIKLHNENNKIRKRVGLSERDINSKVQEYINLIENHDDCGVQNILSTKETNRLSKYCSILQKENNYLRVHSVDSKLKINDTEKDNVEVKFFNLF